MARLLKVYEFSFMFSILHNRYMQIEDGQVFLKINIALFIQPSTTPL